MDASELLKRYKAGERNFRKVNLNGANLSGADLSEADLYGASLISVNLSEANLTRVDLSAGNLMRANLKQANLREAELCMANLAGAHLDEANLTEAKLSGANLYLSKLVGANLQNADLSEANLACSSLTNAVLDGASLDGANLNKVQHPNIYYVNNQGIEARLRWKHFYFRSQAEIKIAEALDRLGVLFYPNCKARLDSSISRDSRESDFLVFYQGRWGILEVDGDESHPPFRTVDDHKRVGIRPWRSRRVARRRHRLFKASGIRIVEHFDAVQCFNQPNSVVQEFLKILIQS